MPTFRLFKTCLFSILLFIILSVCSTALDSSNIKLAKALSNAYVEVTEKVKPVVVTIETTALIKSEQEQSDSESVNNTLSDILPVPMIQFLQRWQEDIPDNYELGNFIGSGVIISEDGLIVTNYHVIENAINIKIRLYDNRSYQADIIGIDPKTDLAVIKIISEDKFAFAELGDSSQCKPGSIVIAIGAPEAFDQSITCGHISAVQRSDNFDDLEDIIYKNFIQTDASINHGNSGGPLVNLDAQVIGINTLGIDDADNINFAIPVNMVKNIVDDILDYGEVKRGYLGAVTYNLQNFYNDNNHNGLLVEKVYPDTPAEIYGIKMGDIILTYDGISLQSTQQLLDLVAKTPIDSKVKIRLIRNNNKDIINVTIAEQPEKIGMPVHSLLINKSADIEQPEFYTSDILGITVVALPLKNGFKEDIEYFKNMTGLLIIDVDNRVSNFCAELIPGMIIKFINFQNISSFKDLNKVENKIKSNSKVLMQSLINNEPVISILDLNLDQNE